MRIRALLVVAVAMALIAPAADAAPVRIFAVGNKQRLADAVTYQTYSDKMAALMDAGFPNRSDFVQAGVDDVASHIRPADAGAPPRALVVFPEDVGLINAFIGSRGAAARSQSSAAAAVGSLLGPYTPQRNYYDGKYPGQPPVRTLVLALTDTFYRSFYETFRHLAIEHRVYIAAAINAAPARRVEEATNPALVALLRDPDEPDRTYAYEAVSPYPTNTTYVFAPDGEILVPNGIGGTRRSPSRTGGAIQGSTKKAYLVPIEQPPPGEAAGLSLGFGAVRDLEVLDTPVGRLGIVISKDAWMVDVNDRFAAKGANLILQPEAFSAWAYVADPWEPDIFKEGGFANLQKLPEFRGNVNASMTGNFFDITFDGQSAIIGRKRKLDPGPLSPRNAWIGQNPDTGFLAMAPWIRRDPGIANSALTLAERRSMLAAAGSKLLPGSGVQCADPLAVGACENGYREAIVWTDLVLPDGPPTVPVDRTRARPERFSSSVRVSRREWVRVPSQAPRVAASGSHVYVVWHEARAGFENVWLAVSDDAGQTFGEPVRVSDNTAGSVAEMYPTVAARRQGVAVAWQEFINGRSDNRGRVKLAHFDPGGEKQGADVRVDDSDLSGKWFPQVALVGREPGTPLVVWIDERDRGPQDLPLEHVYAARASRSGPGFEPAVRVDAGAPVPLAAHLDNKWSPTVTAAGGKVYVAWADFRNYNWDIFSARSDDHGLSFGANVRVDDFPDFERLNERPTLGVDSLGRVHAAWSDLRARQPDTNIFYAQSDDQGASFSPNRQLDDSKAGFDPNRDTPTNQWHPSLRAVGERLFVAWQDSRLGNNDIFFASSANRGATFASSERVDDTGVGRSEQTRPHLAWAGNRCYVVWEDDRNGSRDIYLGRRACPLP